VVELRVSECLCDVIHLPTGYTNFLQLVDPLLLCSPLGKFRDLSLKCLPIFYPPGVVHWLVCWQKLSIEDRRSLGVGGETGVYRQPRLVSSRTELAKLRVISHSENEVTIRSLE
jgi:hypothetical protein